jgi:protoporphyrinogen oxidase
MEHEGTGFVISRNSDFSITACTWNRRQIRKHFRRGFMRGCHYASFRIEHFAVIKRHGFLTLTTGLQTLVEELEKQLTLTKVMKGTKVTHIAAVPKTADAIFSCRESGFCASAQSDRIAETWT